MKEELNITLAHEFYRCSISLNNFTQNLLLLSKKNTVKDRINCYNNYVDFLSHLYEFYMGIIKGSIKPKKGKSHKLYNPNNDKELYEITDSILRFELQKLLRNRKNRILNNYKDNLNLDVIFYDSDVPEDFGKHFRFMRNRRNHSDYKRASNEYDISLIDFYKKYSTFLLIMYRETEWLWKIDIEKYNWKVIDDFSLKILE